MFASYPLQKCQVLGGESPWCYNPLLDVILLDMILFCSGQGVRLHNVYMLVQFLVAQVLPLQTSIP